jgi:hypothetical protein
MQFRTRNWILSALVASGCIVGPSLLTQATPVLGELMSATASAQTQTTTLQAPDNVPDGWYFHLFGQGWGQSFRVQNGQVVLPWNVNSQSTFGNFGSNQDPNAAQDWLRLEDRTSVPAGWGSLVLDGRHAFGNPLATDSVENFLDAQTNALVGPVWDDNANSSFTVSYSGGRARIDLPSRLNSISFSAANSSRPTVGLSTNETLNVGLVNVGNLLQDGTPAVVIETAQGAQVVRATNAGGNTWTAPVAQGTHFQWVYVDGSNRIIAWSTVGAARLGSGVSAQDGTGRSVVGPYSYFAQ